MVKPPRVAIATCAAQALIFHALCTFSTMVTAASAVPPPVPSNAIDHLVADACNKQTVLLGEDGNHGSGVTVSVKGELVKRLINECGFNAVYFESSIYDFLDLQRQIERRSASPEMLADAVGGLWSTTSEADPLFAFLYNKANAGTVYLAGLDLQLGSATSLYQMSTLPIELSAFLAEPRRTQCTSTVHQLTNWTYAKGEQLPSDRTALRNCAIDMQKGISASGHASKNAAAAAMADNFLRQMEAPPDGSFNHRDEAMYDNFVWHRSHRADRNKIIVWCATIHAAKRLPFFANTRMPLGSFVHALQGDKAAVIGFTALGGSYGRNKDAPALLTPAAPNSLEGRAFEGTKGDSVYLDHQQLMALGAISARAINYAKPDTAKWSEVVDSMVVLREEKPPHFVRAARPQQTAARPQ